MNADKMLELQMQVRQNSDEMKSYVNDLNSWENEMKEQEELNQRSGKKDNRKLPPVRNRALLKNKHPQKSKSPRANPDQKSDKIKGWDYKAWDKFDVDKACEEIDANSISDKDEDEDVVKEEVKRLKETAEKSHALKEQGNEYFRQQKYVEAIESYSRALIIDPDNSVLYANRAMSLIKQGKWTAAESDCTESLTIDPKNVKALLRRGTSRIQLKKFEEARLDFREVLLLEPANKQARVELDKLKRIQCKNVSQELSDSNKMSNSIPSLLSAAGDPVIKGLVLPIDKPVADRSKKPLKRIKIEEVSPETSDIVPPNSSSSSSSQFSLRSQQKHDDVFSKFLKECSDAKKETASKDEEDIGIKSNEQLEESSVATSVETRKDCGDSREISSIDTSNSENRKVTELSSTKLSNMIEEINGSVPKLSLLSPTTSTKTAPSQLNLTLPQTSEITTTPASVSESSSTTYPPPPPATTTVTAKTESMLSIPQVPTTSFQFQSDWKRLRNKDFEFFSYFKNIEPSHYRSLFGEALESDMLQKIIRTLHAYYIKENLDAYKVLFYLPSVKRFSMVVMFLSSSDKSLLKEIFAKISVGGVYSVEDVNQLRIMFEL